MRTHSLITQPSPSDSYGTDGIDMLKNPAALGNRKLVESVNMVFDEGTLKTRPGFHYSRLGVSGQFQGASVFNPALGLSSQSFSTSGSGLVSVVGGKVYINDAEYGRVRCSPIEICGDSDFCNRGTVHVYQAENWLIVQNPVSNTFFWPGFGCLLPSPGMAGCHDPNATKCAIERVYAACGCGEPIFEPEDLPNPCRPPHEAPHPSDDDFEEVDCGEENLDHSHDSFDARKHQNWLANSSGLGVYAHGRVHQENQHLILVGDLIHKRGHTKTDDVLKMEEQSLQSYGDPLSTNSKMGKLRALVTLTDNNTANGEGDLIGYYDNGVVAYNTFQFPRETRIDGDGVILQGGWDTKQMVAHLTTSIGAVGHRAVAQMPQDHFFRSPFGAHFLKILLGDGSFRMESINSIAQDVQPLLDEDEPDYLEGAACGFWQSGHRLFLSTGLDQDDKIGALPHAKGMAVANMASTFSEDRSPKFIWESIWVFDHAIAGMHQFVTLGETQATKTFGFLVSDKDAEVYFASPNLNYEKDYRDGEWLPVEWSFISSQLVFTSYRETSKISRGLIEGVFSECSDKIRVWIRTDRDTNWAVWFEDEDLDKPASKGSKYRRDIDLGQPPASHREGTWAQVKVEGLGFAEIHSLTVETVEGTEKTRSKCDLVKTCRSDIFQINHSPPETRWT